MSRGQRNRSQGFTLIEIVVVLVVLGILAVVALPKYIDMQKQAAAKTLQYGVAALASQVNFDYVNAIMLSPGAASSWTGNANASGLTVGDFAGSYTIDSGSVTVVVTGGATAQGNSVYNEASALTNFADFASKVYQLYP